MLYGRTPSMDRGAIEERATQAPNPSHLTNENDDLKLEINDVEQKTRWFIFPVEHLIYR